MLCSCAFCPTPGARLSARTRPWKGVLWLGVSLPGEIVIRPHVLPGALQQKATARLVVHDEGCGIARRCWLRGHPRARVGGWARAARIEGHPGLIYLFARMRLSASPK